MRSQKSIASDLSLCLENNRRLAHLGVKEERLPPAYGPSFG